MLENLHRFLVYTLLTSTGGWDTGRAITNAVAIVVLGPAILATLRRAPRRATVTGVALDLPTGLTGSADEIREQVGREGRHLLFPPLVSFVALAFSLVVSVFKPWGRTRRGRARVERQRRAKVTTA